MTFEERKRYLMELVAGRDPKPPSDEEELEDSGVEGTECAHCGTPFELGTTHPLCRKCRGSVCYSECSISSCAGWGPGFSIVDSPDGEEIEDD